MTDEHVAAGNNSILKDMSHSEWQMCLLLPYSVGLMSLLGCQQNKELVMLLNLAHK